MATKEPKPTAPLPYVQIRIVHDNAGGISHPHPRAAEVLMDGRVIAQLPITGYTLAHDVGDIPALSVRLLLESTGDLTTRAPGR